MPVTCHHWLYMTCIGWLGMFRLFHIYAALIQVTCVYVSYSVAVCYDTFSSSEEAIPLQHSAMEVMANTVLYFLDIYYIYSCGSMHCTFYVIYSACILCCSLWWHIWWPSACRAFFICTTLYGNVIIPFCTHSSRTEILLRLQYLMPSIPDD